MLEVEAPAKLTVSLRITAVRDVTSAQNGIYSVSCAAYGAEGRVSCWGSALAYAYGNPDIRSERMQSVEAGWEKRVGSGRLVATAYLFRLSDLIAPDSVTGVVRNSPALTGRGLEFEFEQRWRERYSLRAGYTLRTEHLSRIRRCVCHLLTGRIVDQHHTVGLDRPRNVNRFAIAVCKVGLAETRLARKRCFAHQLPAASR